MPSLSDRLNSFQLFAHSASDGGQAAMAALIARRGEADVRERTAFIQEDQADD